MTTDYDSGLSSPLSSISSSRASSPLSSVRSSLSPPPEMFYPSPPASQENSASGSPAPSGMDTDKDGPPPTKRRRISKERTTEYLDLRYSEVEPEQQPQLKRLLHVLHKRQKIVVIAGAGISVSAGIPDFRSSSGLFRSLKEEHKLKGSGKHLFDASVYKDDTSTSSFHDMVSSMSRLTKDAKPTAFHHMLATIAKEDRLLRLYSQNVDGIDTALEPLKTAVPLGKDQGGKWPRTVQLHGGLDKMVCSKCHALSDFVADLFSGPTPPLCRNCEDINNVRTVVGKRSHGIGKLRPRMVLYNEHNPDDVAIGSVTREDLRKRPDAVIVAGTTLKVPGVRRIVREMCGIVRDRRGGVAIWINNDLPPVAKELDDCFDIVVQGPCDEVASRAAMRNWDDPIEQDTFLEISDEDAKKAEARTGEVHLPDHKVPHPSLEAVLDSADFKNSFKAPSLTCTPQKRKMSPVDTGDWSPIPSRRSSVLQSIESDGESIAVHVPDGGLLTPIKSQKNTPEKKLTSLNDKLKDAGKSKKSVSKSSKPSAVTKPKKQSNVKYVKTSAKSKPKTVAAAKPQSKANAHANTITNTFKTSKTGATEVQKPAKKSTSSPAKNPSKLRQVSNVGSEPMHPLSPQDPRSNFSPSKRKPFFPNLQSENVSKEESKELFSASELAT